MPEGLIVKSQGGFYDVAVAGEENPKAVIWCCRPRGIFRKEGMIPKVGDRVSVEQGTSTSPGTSKPLKASEPVGTITVIHPRKNELLRPLLSNLDLLFLVNAACDPSPNLFLIDQLLATAAHQEITPVLVFTKNDLKSTQELQAVYRNVGVPVFALHHGYSAEDPVVQDLTAMMAGKISAFIGNSGVGKSTLLNLLYPAWQLQTGEISAKLGRGRHTTRHVQLHRLPERSDCGHDYDIDAGSVADTAGYVADTAGYVADTPGFGTMDFLRYQQLIRKEELPELFLEFRPYLGRCKFTGCSHTVEQGCAVLAALATGAIGPTRHKSYTMLYEELRQIPDWQKK